MVLWEFLPVVLVVVAVVALLVVRKSFRFPKSFEETRKSREVIIKQKRKKEEMEKVQQSLYDEE